MSPKMDVGDGANKLLLLMPTQKNILEIFITLNHLIFNGLNYQLDDRLINKFRATNEYPTENR